MFGGVPKRARMMNSLALQRAGGQQTALENVLRIVRENPHVVDNVGSRMAMHRDLEDLRSLVGHSEELTTPSGDFTWDTLSLPAVLRLS